MSTISTVRRSLRSTSAIILYIGLVILVRFRLDGGQDKEQDDGQTDQETGYVRLTFGGGRVNEDDWEAAAGCRAVNGEECIHVACVRETTSIELFMPCKLSLI